MNIKKRVLDFISSRNIPISEFERRCSLSNGYISSMRKGFGTEKLDNVLNEFPELNRDWLLYGEGEMLKSEAQFTETTPTKQRTSVTKENNALLEHLQKENKELKAENKAIIKEIGKLEGRLDASYELIEILKK